MARQRGTGPVAPCHGAASVSAGSKRMGALRRALYLVGLGAAVFVTVLPLLLMLVGSECKADEAGALHDPPSWFQQANPFSHSNLCRIKRNVGTHVPGVSSTPVHHVGWVGDHPSSSSSSSSSRGTSSTMAHKDTPPRPAEEVAAEASQQRQWARQRQANKQRQRRVAGETFDEVELPDDDADVERILRHPHYDECNLCKVCVPLDVVAHHPKAQAHPANRKVHLTQMPDEDITIEVEAHASAAAASGAAAQHSLQLHSGAPSARLAGYGQAAGAAGSGAEARSWRLPVGGDLRAGRGNVTAGRSDVMADERHVRQLLPAPIGMDKSDEFYHIKGKTINLHDIAPGDTKRGPRKELQNCTVCWGCSHTLEMMASGSVMAGSYYSHEPGGSPSWLFRVRSNRTRSGWAVVKTWCVPVRKVKQRGLAMCVPQKVYAQVKLLLAQNKVIRQCGLSSIIPTLWVAPVRGVIPGHGFRINWLGLWADVADGVSVQNIHEFGKPRTDPKFLLDLLTRRVNHTEIQMVATFDVLTSQCDRHQQNLFLTESGKVWAIDNDQVYGVAWRPCGVDSMLLPTTQKFMINHLGFFYVLKYPQADPPRTWVTSLNPLMALDYRCHVEGGVLGTNYPGQLTQCMKHIGGLSVDQIQRKYGYPSIHMAQAIRNRSRDLITQGFEWTLLYGLPTNLPMHRYKVAPACCNMTYRNQARTLVCTTPWKQMSEIPYGNAWHGGAWHGTPGKDTGSYEGGSVF